MYIYIYIHVTVLLYDIYDKHKFNSEAARHHIDTVFNFHFIQNEDVAIFQQPVGNECTLTKASYTNIDEEPFRILEKLTPYASAVAIVTAASAPIANKLHLVRARKKNALLTADSSRLHQVD